MLPFNTDLVSSALKRPVGAVPLEMVITPDGEKPTRILFWVKPMSLPSQTVVDQQKAVVVAPFWLMAKHRQEAKQVAADGEASQDGVAAIQGVDVEHLVYQVVEFNVPGASAIGRPGRKAKSKVVMRTLHLTNDMSLRKGARLLVKDDLPAALEDTM